MLKKIKYHHNRPKEVTFLLLLFLMLFIGISNQEKYLYLEMKKEIKENQLVINIRSNIFIQLSSQLGFGGLIHNFKNYIIRGDLEYKNKVEAEFLSIDSILNQYSALELMGNEKISLQHIKVVLNSYKTKFDLAREYANMSPRLDAYQLDSLVKIDDTLMLNGLSCLKESINDFKKNNSYAESSIKKVNDLFALLKACLLFLILIIIIRLLFFMSKYKENNLVLTGLQLNTLEEKRQQEQLAKLKSYELDIELKRNKKLLKKLNISAIAFEANEAIIITTPTLKIINVNNAFTTITGYSKQDILGEKISILKSGRQDAMFYQQMWQKIGETGGWSGRVINKAKDGREFIAWLSITQLKNENGTTENYIAHLRDITQFSHTQAALSRRLKIESMVSNFVIKVLEASSDNFNVIINDYLHVIGKELLVDRSYIFEFKNNYSSMSKTYEWCSHAVEPKENNLQDISVNPSSWVMSHLLKKRIVQIDDVNNLPMEAATEKAEFYKQGISSLVLFPIFGANEIIGFLGFDRMKEQRGWRKEDIDLLKIIAEIFYLVQHRYKIEKENNRNILELKRLINEKTGLLEKNNLLTLGIIRAQETERRFIAQELHDELGQIITAIKLKAGYLYCQGVPEDAKETIRKIEALSVEAISRLRLTTRKIRTATLDQSGINSALRELLNDWRDCNREIEVELELSDEINALLNTKTTEFAEEVMITLYRAVQEALTNITKYAQAEKVIITLTKVISDKSVSIYLTILDDGIGGVDSSNINSGIGLFGMKERVLSLKGELYISPGENSKGTYIQIYIPM